MKFYEASMKSENTIFVQIEKPSKFAKMNVILHQNYLKIIVF